MISFDLGPTGFAGSIAFTGTPNSGQSLRIGGNRYTLLYSMADLENINASDATLSGKYALALPIDASTDPTMPVHWLPIGLASDGIDILNSGNGFSGTFEGLGNSVANLMIAPNAYAYGGLFGFVNGRIRDFGVVGGSESGDNIAGGLTAASGTNSVLSSDYSSMSVSNGSELGGLVGGANGVIAHSFATGAVSETTLTGYAGGLVGQSNAILKFDRATGSVTGETEFGIFGGLVGLNFGSILQSSASGDISGSTYAQLGGLAGYNDDIVNRSYATGSVTGGMGSIVGGLVGNTFVGSPGAYISQSFATGAVITGANGYAGGLAGFSPNPITNSYATGSVTGTTGSDVGGLVGYNGQTSPNTTFGTIRKSYATGLVSDGADVGGLVGDDQSPAGSIRQSYWDLNTSGISDPGQGTGNVADDPGITGETTAALQSGLPAGFSAAVWASAPDAYPVLLWQNPAP